MDVKPFLGDFPVGTEIPYVNNKGEPCVAVVTEIDAANMNSCTGCVLEELPTDVCFQDDIRCLGVDNDGPGARRDGRWIRFYQKTESHGL